MRWARSPTTEQSMRVTQLKPNADVCRKLNNNNLPTETQIFVLLTVFTLFFIRQKEERLQKEDLERRGRENDYGCSPATTAATRRTGRRTPAGSAANPEGEADAQLTTTRVGLSVGWRQFWNQRPNLFFFFFIIIIMLPISLYDLNPPSNRTMFTGNTKLTIKFCWTRYHEPEVLLLWPVSQSSPRYVCQSLSPGWRQLLSQTGIICL